MARPPRLRDFAPVPAPDPEPQLVVLGGDGFKPGVQVIVNDLITGYVTASTINRIDWMTTLPASGDVTLRVRNNDGRVSNALTVAVTPDEPPDVIPPPEEEGYGPRPITQPPNAILVAPGQSLQSLTNQAPAGSTFWLLAGEHRVSGPVTPKSGNVYLGELGAVLDGTGWSSTDIDDAAFKALNQDVDDVHIENLVIRNMPSYGIQAYRNFSDRWIVFHCEIHHCRSGLSVPSGSTVQNCWIHHCAGNPNESNPSLRGGGYVFDQCDDVRFEHNQVGPENGLEQKFLMGLRLVCLGNWFHHNQGDGFWIDGEGNGSLVEGNLAEFNGRTGYTIEAGLEVEFRHNTSRNNAASGLLLSMSRNCTVHHNTFDNDRFPFDLFLNCDSLTEGYPWEPDLRDNTLTYNSITFGPLSEYATILSWISGGTCYPPYVSNEKNNTFDYNTYTMSDGPRWLWGGQHLNFAGWQGMGQDPHGVLVLGRRRIPLTSGITKRWDRFRDLLS